MLTTRDLNKVVSAIEKVFDRNIDNKLIPIRGDISQLTRALYGLRNDFTESQHETNNFRTQMTEFKEEMTEFKEETLRILEAILDDLHGKHESQKNFDSRISKLEDIHPEYQHFATP